MKGTQASTGGVRTLPRKKMQDYSWLSMHIPQSLQAVVRQLADAEDRTMSSMARHLMEDGLRYRGLDVPKRGGEQDDSEDDD